MPRKSNVRLHAEAGLAGAGLDISYPSCVFVDRSKSGHRVKFSFVTANPDQIESILAVVETLNSGHHVKVWNQPAKHSRGYNGLCVKIFNK